MSTDSLAPASLVEVRNSPVTIKAFIEDYLKERGPRPGKYLITRIKGYIDTRYAMSLQDTILGQPWVQVEFEVRAVDTLTGCLEVEVVIGLDTDGKPGVSRVTLTQNCLPPRGPF